VDLAVRRRPVAGARRAPAPRAISPELASLAERPPSGEDWLHEIKFDGYRMVAHIRQGTATLVSRNGNDWTARFPELAKTLGGLPTAEAWLDGEVVHMERTGITSFSALQKDLSDGTTARLIYMVFDLPYFDGWDLTAAALDDRKALLAALLSNAPPEFGRTIRFSDHQIGKGPAFFAEACKRGLEGIISKRRDAPYFEGRSFAWIKSKCIAQQEFVIVGFTDPKGTRIGFGALLLGYYTPAGDLVYAGKAGTGFSIAFLDRFYRELRRIERTASTVALPKGLSRRGVHWVEPRFVAEIGFGEWTRDGILRQPRFLGLREDKPARDVMLELPAPRATAAR
jgi:bifunctional non-homologous end joining protein LigD